MDQATDTRLERIAQLVSKYAVNGEWPDDIFGASGGNYDDAFSMGVSFGEAALATQIQLILLGK